MTVGPGGVERARVSLRVVPDVSAVYEAVNAAVQYIEKLTPHLKVDADTKKARAEIAALARDARNSKIKLGVEIADVGKLIDLFQDVDIKANLDVERMEDQLADFADLAGTIDPIRMPVDFDTDGARANLDGLGDEGSRIAEQLRFDFEDALGNLDIDAPDFTDLADKVKDGLKDIQDDLKPLKTPLHVDSKAAAREAAAALAAVQAIVAKGADIPVGLDHEYLGDISRALGSLEALDGVLDGIKRKGKINVEFDFDKESFAKLVGDFEAIHKRFGEKPIKVDIEPDIDRSAFIRAAAELKVLSGIIGRDGIEVPIKPDLDLEPLKAIGPRLRSVGQELATQLYAPFEGHHIVDADLIFDPDFVEDVTKVKKRFTENMDAMSTALVRTQHGLVRINHLTKDWIQGELADLLEAQRQINDFLNNPKSRVYGPTNVDPRGFSALVRERITAWVTGDNEYLKQAAENRRKLIREAQATAAGIDAETKKIRHSWQNAFQFKAGSDAAFGPSFDSKFTRSMRNARDSAKLSFGAIRDAYKGAQEGVEKDAAKGGIFAGKGFVGGFGKGLRGLKDVWSNAFTQRFWMQAAVVGGIGAGGDLLTVAGGLTKVVGALNLLPAAASAGAGAFTSVKLALYGMGEALTANDPEVLEEALSRLHPEARKFAEVLTDEKFRQAWRDMRTGVQGAFFEGLAGPLKTMTTSLLPQLSAGLEAVSRGWNAIAKESFAAITTMSDSGVIAKVLARTGTMLTEMSKGTKGFFQAFSDLAEVGSEYLQPFGKWTADLTNRFAEFIAEAKKTGQINVWIENAVQALKDFWSILDSTVRIFQALTKAASAAGGSSLGQFAKAMETVAKAMEGVRAQGAIIALLAGANKGIASLFKVAGPAMGDALEAVAKALGRIFEVAGPVVGQGLTVFFNFLKEVAPRIASAVEAMAPGLSQLFTEMAKVSPELGKAIGDALIQVGHAVGEIAKAIAGWLSGGGADPIMHIIGAVGQLAKAFGDIVGAVAPALPIIAQIFKLIYDFFIGPIIDNIVQFVQGFANFAEGLKKLLSGDIVGGLQQMFTGIVQGLGAAFMFLLNFFKLGFLAKILGPLKNLLPGVMNIGLRFAQGFFEAVIKNAAQWFPKLAGLGKKVLDVLGGAFKGLGSFITTHLKNAGAAIVNGVKSWIALGRANAVKAVEALKSGWSKLTGFLGGVMRSARDAIVNGVKLWAAGARAQMGRVIDALKRGWDAAGRVIMDSLRQTGEHLKMFFSTIRNGFGKALGFVVEKLTWAKTIALGFLTSVVTSAVVQMQQFSGAIGDGVSAHVQWFADLPGRIWGAISGLGDWLKGVAGDMIRGFVDGLSGGFSIDGLIQKVGGGLDALRKFLGINSPSKVTTEIGKNMAEGLPIGLRPLGGLDLVTPIKRALDAVRALLPPWVGDLAKAGAAAVRALVSPLTALGSLAAAAITAAQSQIAGPLRAVVGLFASAGRAILGAITSALNAVSRAIITATNSWARIFSTVMNTLGNIVRAGFNAIVALVRNALGAIWTALINATNAWARAMSTALNTLKNIAQNGWNAIKGVFDNALKAIWDKVTEWMGKIGDAVSSGIDNVVGFFGDLPGKIMDALAGLPGALWDMGKNVVNGFLGGLSSGFDTSPLTNYMDRLKDNVMTSWGMASPRSGCVTPGATSSPDSTRESRRSTRPTSPRRWAPCSARSRTSGASIPPPRSWPWSARTSSQAWASASRRARPRSWPTCSASSRPTGAWSRTRRPGK